MLVCRLSDSLEQFESNDSADLRDFRESRRSFSFWGASCRRKCDTEPNHSATQISHFERFRAPTPQSILEGHANDRFSCESTEHAKCFLVDDARVIWQRLAHGDTSTGQ